MIIFPAVDIKDGQAVRLRRGRMDDATVFSPDPLAMAARWQEQGAQWLHVVDLDGAVRGARVNAAIIGGMAKLGIAVQAGGGVRTRDDASQYLEAGVTRLIVGTMALEEPETFRAVCREFPGRIGVSLDADGGRLKTRGWLNGSEARAADVIPRLEDAGAAFIIYTDIQRDGMGAGVNLTELGRVLELTRLPVIAAGGVSTLADLRALMPLAARGNFQGVISGRALYEGSLDLREALALFAASDPSQGQGDAGAGRS